MDALLTVEALNRVIMDTGEDECAKLLAFEKQNRKRRSVLLRLHSRINLLRAQREREELTALAE